MNASARPRFADFRARVGQSFRVHADEGPEVDRCRLQECLLLAHPGLPALKNEDCFLFVFDCTNDQPQGICFLAADDGYTARLFAVPDAAGSMCVTVN